MTKAASKPMANAQDLDTMDLDMLARALLTPQVCSQETQWMVAQPHLESQPARSADASRGKRQPKARQARKRPSEPSTCRKAAQTRKQRSTQVASPPRTVQITQRSSDEQVARNALSTDNSAMGTSAYAVADVLDAIMDAFDDVLICEVPGNANSVRTRFRVRVIRNLLALCLQRILEANSPQNVLSVSDVTEHVFGMLEGFGISIQ